MLQALCFVGGYPNGAPTGACEDMMPRHSGVLPQPSAAPYTLLTNTRTFQPGKPITVTVTGPEYRGVLLEARTDGSTNALGSWKIPPPDTKFLQVNHKHFPATVAQQRTVYWVNVRSITLTTESPGVSLAAGASARMAGKKPLLVLGICFLMLQVL
ncbi:putative defense protein 1 [Morone saxatilis]|uniref:putative defense protein 1 n=1 Tax=Morone saxatilis TaxID=34816 RepID=UPI0015E21B25|nr:putative defense protein 1 [Morone saxatilis]